MISVKHFGMFFELEKMEKIKEKMIHLTIQVL